MNSFMWSIDKTQTGITNPGQSGPGSNGNEGALQIPLSSSTRDSPSNAVYCHTLFTCCRVGGVLPLCRGTVGVFYTPSWQLAGWGGVGGQSVVLGSKIKIKKKKKKEKKKKKSYLYSLIQFVAALFVSCL